MLQESLGTELRTVTGLDSDDNDETEGDLEAEDIRTRNRYSFGVQFNTLHLLRELMYK